MTGLPPEPETPSLSGFTRQLSALEMRQLADEQFRVTFERNAKAQRHGRRAENALIWVAVGAVVLRVLVETVHEIAGMFLTLKPHPHPFPWAFVAIFLGSILPKTLGRASAGKVWEILATGGAKLIGRGRPRARSAPRRQAVGERHLPAHI